MDSKIPVLLSTGELLEKYHNFCFQHHFTERFMVRLFDAQLVRGQNNRKSKSIVILESSFLELVKHVNFNLQLQMFVMGDEKISVPEYCSSIPVSRVYELENAWYTASELIHELTFMKYLTAFSVEFMNELVERGMLRGRHERGQKQILILKPSFIELIYYRNYIIEQNKILLKDLNLL